MDRLKKPIEFLTKLRLTDSDYMDSGMIIHIADLLERYHQEQLILSGVRFELPNDEIFKQDIVNLKNPLEEFYYYEAPSHSKWELTEFTQSFKKALAFLKGN